MSAGRAKEAKLIQWKGDLSRPIVWSGPRSRNLTPTAVHTEPPTKEAQERHAQRYDAARSVAESEVFRKLDLLKTHLEITRGPAENLDLAVALATIYVPGFRIINREQTRGRKRKWADFKCIALIIEVDATKAKPKTDSDIEALREIVRRKNHYIEGPPPRTPKTIDAAAKSLNARLVEARKRASADRFQSFLASPARVIFRHLHDVPGLDVPRLLASNFD
jgi:hypothetical protein